MTTSSQTQVNKLLSNGASLVEIEDFIERQAIDEGERAMGMRRLAYFAATLAFASAAMRVFWTLGGTWLLDTVGGSIEELARTRSPSALTVGTAASLAKLGAALLALALVRPWGRHVPDRVLKGANVFVSVVLVMWGGANVLVGALALTGAVSPADGLDERALRWHVFVWDLWFLLWGVTLALALSGFWARERDDNRPASGGPQRPRPSWSAQRRQRRPG